MRLIDADAFLVDSIKEKRFVFCSEDMLGEQVIVKTVYDELANALKHAPTVDAVEVVRCKDCAEYMPWLYGEKICGLLGSYHGDTKPDDYCSRGRKR